MKLPSFRRINEQDFDQEDRSFVQKLGSLVNINFENIYTAISNKLTFQDNIISTIVTLSVAVDSEGAPLQSTVFKLDVEQTEVQGIITLYAKGTKNTSVIPTGGVYIDYTKNDNNTVTINYIKGLVPEIPYTIKILVI
jgi:hypothetical protein